MTQIDPMVVPMPDVWAEDPQIQPFIDYWLRWSYAMWEAVTSGTGVSTIENYVYEGSTEKTVSAESFDFESDIELLFPPARHSCTDEKMEELQMLVQMQLHRINDLQEQIEELQMEKFENKAETGENFDKRYGFMT